MKAITIHTQIAEDGVLKLEVPCDLPLKMVEVSLVVRPLETPPTAEKGPLYRSLRGIWADKLPDIDIEADLKEMNKEWEKSLGVVK
jgi:hypothetical protein